MKLVSVAEMRAIEKEADSKGVSYAQMMENAGRGLAELVHAMGRENGWEEVTGLAGAGNIGGGRHFVEQWLARRGWDTPGDLFYLKKNEGVDNRLSWLRGGSGNSENH